MVVGMVLYIAALVGRCSEMMFERLNCFEGRVATGSMTITTLDYPSSPVLEYSACTAWVVCSAVCSEAQCRLSSEEP